MHGWGCDVFALKRFLGEFLYPLNAWVAICLFGIILCLWKPRRIWGTALMLAGTVWLVVASLPATGYPPSQVH